MYLLCCISLIGLMNTQVLVSFGFMMDGLMIALVVRRYCFPLSSMSFSGG